MGSMPNELKRQRAPEEQELARKLVVRQNSNEGLKGVKQPATGLFHTFQLSSVGPLAELAARESLLADRELELATLNAELSAFNRRYINRVGARYAELDEIEARIAETKAKNSSHDAHASKVAAAARERAAESGKVGEALAKSAPRANFKPTDRLKNLYREVAKAVHPDLGTDEEERARRNKFMADGNQGSTN